MPDDVDLASAVILPCPECRSGKHVNCSKWSLDEQTDDVVACPCNENGHSA